MMCQAEARIVADPKHRTENSGQLSLDDTVTQLRQQGDWFASQAPRHKVSILQDLEQGKRLEVEETL
jgi:ketopantoate reductase